jgi:positive regulator of sigma E activity
VQQQEECGARKNVAGVADPVLSEAVQRLAAEAAMRLTSLVTAGDQIPFDIAEDSGESASFFRYVPLSGRYIAER